MSGSVASFGLMATRLPVRAGSGGWLGLTANVAVSDTVRSADPGSSPKLLISPGRPHRQSVEGLVRQSFLHYFLSPTAGAAAFQKQSQPFCYATKHSRVLRPETPN